MLLYFYGRHSLYSYFVFFFLMIRRPPRSTLFPTRRSSDLLRRQRCGNHGGRVAARRAQARQGANRSEEHTSELQSQSNLVCRLLLEKKTNITVKCTAPQQYRIRTSAVRTGG